MYSPEKIDIRILYKDALKQIREKDKIIGQLRSEVAHLEHEVEKGKKIVKRVSKLSADRRKEIKETSIYKELQRKNSTLKLRVKSLYQTRDSLLSKIHNQSED